MSRTERKNGGNVWTAWIIAAGQGEGVHYGYATTAQIAREAGMSKPTVAKYMGMMAESGNVRKIQFQGSAILWGWSEQDD